MQPRSKSMRIHRSRSARWSRRPDVGMGPPSRDLELLQVPVLLKHEGGLGDAVVDIQECEPGSPSSQSVSTRGAAAADAWMDCASAMKDYEDAKIQGWKEEIDTHLVFAGLFSAILTAFNVEAYKLLQPQDPDPSQTNLLLALLIENMAQSNGNADLASKAAALATQVSSGGSADPRSRRSAVAINALWFCSLICSLAAASLSIQVKQWLNQYTSGMASVSPEIARVRQFRYDNLRKWRVAEIMMLLPILLQGALVLFLIGLIEFLAPLDAAVTKAASILVSMLLAFIAITAVLPTFISDCSYQSPQAWGMFVIVQAIKKPIRSVARSIYSYANRLATPHADGTLSRLRNRLAKMFVQHLTRFANKPDTYSWKARERILVEENGPILDRHLLVGADATFLDDTFLRNVIQPCLNDMSPVAAVECYYRIMDHRADRVVNGVLYFDTKGTESRAESLAILTDITLDTLQKTRAERLSIEHPIRILRTLEPLLVRSLPYTYCHFCTVLFSLLDDPDTTVRHLAFTVLYQQLSRNVELAEQHAAAGCHDLSALVAFISNARTDGDIKLFLDACDLVVCLATLPTSLPDMRDHLRDTLLHLQSFFETPLWKHEPRLLYPISRIAPHLVALERRYPRVLEDELVGVLEEVMKHAKGMNHDGNWEDKIIILEATLQELSVVRQGQGGSTQSTLNEERTHARRPSFMRNAALYTLDV